MKTLAIVGKGPGWERAYRDHKNNREIWCVSTIFNELQTIDVQPSRIFQLHDRSVFEPWIEQEQKRVVLIKDDTNFPHAGILPIEKLLSIFGGRFGSTMAWMFGLALIEGYEEITFRGIHVSHMSEYGGQRDSLMWFIGLAQGKGIKVNIDEDCGLFIANQAYGVL